MFGKKGWIQNSPSQPDLAYPIETVWAELKARVGFPDVRGSPIFEDFIKKRGKFY